jgi:hypothetical protein
MGFFANEAKTINQFELEALFQVGAENEKNNSRVNFFVNPFRSDLQDNFFNEIWAEFFARKTTF